MVESLSQKQINELMRNISSREEEPLIEEKISYEKVYREEKKKNTGFKFSYNSPVIKAKNIIYNPLGKLEEPDDIFNIPEKTIVRDINNYNEYIKQKSKKTI